MVLIRGACADSESLNACMAKPTYTNFLQTQGSKTVRFATCVLLLLGALLTLSNSLVNMIMTTWFASCYVPKAKPSLPYA